METFKTCAVIYVGILIASMIVEAFLPSSNSWEDLQKQYPHLKSLQDKRDKNSTKNFILIMAALLIAFGLLYTSATYKNEFVSVIFLPLAALKITESIETLKNGVFPIIIGRNFVKYFYDERNAYSWVAKIKAVFASTGTLLILWKLIQYFTDYFI